MLWLTFLAPLAAMVAGRSPIGKHRTLWWGMFGAGCLGMLIYLGVDLSNYLEDSHSIRDGLKRASYATITNTDFPFIQLSLASLVALTALRLINKPATTRST